MRLEVGPGYFLLGFLPSFGVMRVERALVELYVYTYIFEHNVSAMAGREGRR
jgi:hypothetical protein